jgi:hypothetical protein
MELIVASGLMKEALVMDLYHDADELLAMTVASIKTAGRDK